MLEQGLCIRVVNVMRLEVPSECAIAFRSVNGLRPNTLIVGRGATDNEAATEALRRLACLDLVDDIDWDAPGGD